MRALLILAAAALFAAGVSIAADQPPAQTVTVTTTQTRTVRVLASYQHHSTRWWAHRAVRNRREANRLKASWRPTVDYAIGVACTTFRVPCSQMHTVAQCESTKNPAAANGQYRGLFQEGSMFYRSPFSWLGSPFDPLLNALTAAWTVAREGWRQWECRP